MSKVPLYLDSLVSPQEIPSIGSAVKVSGVLFKNSFRDSTPPETLRKPVNTFPLPSEEGPTSNVFGASTRKRRPESGLDCLKCTEFSRQR